MGLQLCAIVTLGGYSMRADGMVNGDGYFYLDTATTAKLLRRYFTKRYSKVLTQYSPKGDTFASGYGQYDGSIILYCPNIPANVLAEVRALCNMLVSHDGEGRRIAPAQGLLKAENGREVVRIHAKTITCINRPKAGTLLHYRYLKELKNKI